MKKIFVAILFFFVACKAKEKWMHVQSFITVDENKSHVVNQPQFRIIYRTELFDNQTYIKSLHYKTIYCSEQQLNIAYRMAKKDIGEWETFEKKTNKELK